MTVHKDLKSLIRERQAKTGESYTAARVHVMRERAELLGVPVAAAVPRERLEAVVLKVNDVSARVRLVAEGVLVTFRSGDVFGLGTIGRGRWRRRGGLPARSSGGR